MHKDCTLKDRKDRFIETMNLSFLFCFKIGIAFIPILEYNHT